MKQSFDVLVIGAGPAGIAAALRAAECQRSVGLVDDNPSPGGQIWRGGVVHPNGGAPWLELLSRSSVTPLYETRVFDQPAPGLLFAEAGETLVELRYKKLVLATGAREMFLPFPGWTLPNVMGAGGLQALVKSGLPIAGKRVVVAGSGPLLLAVAATLRGYGAEIVGVCEQASWRNLATFATRLGWRKLGQAVRLKRELAGVPFYTDCWPLSAAGHGKVERVLVSHRGSPREWACDYLACGFHLTPNTELAALLGCQLENGFVKTDRCQQTSVADVFCAGEPTGIGGVELALLQGQLAGLCAGGDHSGVVELVAQQRAMRPFAARLAKAFALRPELTALATPETLVCRCEDVTLARLRECNSWREGKLYTRCGMGPCQGRVCGPATQFILGWQPESVRPPVFPARVESLLAAASHAEMNAETNLGTNAYRNSEMNAAMNANTNPGERS